MLFPVNFQAKFGTEDFSKHVIIWKMHDKNLSSCKLHIDSKICHVCNLLFIHLSWIFFTGWTVFYRLFWNCDVLNNKLNNTMETKENNVHVGPKFIFDGSVNMDRRIENNVSCFKCSSKESWSLNFNSFYTSKVKLGKKWTEKF